MTVREYLTRKIDEYRDYSGFAAVDLAVLCRRLARQMTEEQIVAACRDLMECDDYRPPTTANIDK